MLMFRFWSSDSRGSEKIVDATLPMPLFAKPVQAFLDSTTATRPYLNSGKPLKRRRQSIDEVTVVAAGQGLLPPKRIKIEAPDVRAEQERAEQGRAASCHDAPPALDAPGAALMERAKDVIQFQMGLEILHKHDELRLINQELAKCQVALEQLRRCHLIPYPVTCPTPEQMLEISSGKGPAVRARPGDPVPEWAPPFGVVDGPYARHYAKWLIPDPKFDGVLPAWQSAVGPAAASRSTAEGRTTRNSIGEIGSFGKQRPGRGLSSHKLHSLSAGYPQPKDKAGPCVLKRSDGQTVKLVCIDCNRENFSSTQGFINHCRIAHKRDFKSHEEAAVHCGHPIEVDEAAGSATREERTNSGASVSLVPAASSASSASSAPTLAPGLVHPYARSESISEEEAYVALRARIQASLKLQMETKVPQDTRPDVTSSTSAVAAPKAKQLAGTAGSSGFVGADDAPFLSKLLVSRNFSGNLAEQVADAKTREEVFDWYPMDEDSEDGEQASSSTGPASPVNRMASRAPGVMRMPARAPMVPSGFSTGIRPSSSKACAPHMAFETPMATPTNEMPPLTRSDSGLYEDEMDVDLSPNTMASNNAPSLVSDDGEYDDSDVDDDSDSVSASDASEVTEIKLEDDHEVQDQMSPRPLRKARSSSVNLKKDDNRHVTFVSPVRGTGKARRRKQQAPS